MKKIISIFITCFLFSSFSFSQGSESSDLSMGEGKNVVSVGVGFPHFGYGAHIYRGSGYTYRALPSIILQYERGITEKIPQSILGVGPYVSYSTYQSGWRDRYSVDYWDSRLQQITIAGKVYYHHKFLVGAKWDVYAAAFVGVHIRIYSFTSNDPYYYTVYDRNYSSVYPTGGAVIGGRYYFSKNFGVYAEAGYGASYISGGLSLNF